MNAFWWFRRIVGCVLLGTAALAVVSGLIAGLVLAVVRGDPAVAVAGGFLIAVVVGGILLGSTA